jgi:1-acyl-sn-glycerol-3-phosphate acyltransferase
VEFLFVALYRFLKNHRSLFWVLFIASFAALGFTASRIQFEEDITQFFPRDKRVEKLNYIFQNSKLAERLVMMVSIRDSSAVADADSLVTYADASIEKIESDLAPYVKEIQGRVDEEKITEVMDVMREYLPVFLDDSDYKILDSLSQPEAASIALQNNYRQLISPSGLVMKNIIVNDPLGFSFIVLKKLQQLQYDDSFELHDNYIVTRDHRHLIYFLQPVHGPNETGKNAVFLEGLHHVMDSINARHPSIYVSCFGAAEVAKGNAVQLRKDTYVTGGAMIALLAFFLFGFFRRKRVVFLIFVPVAFGALLALSLMVLIKGSVSILAIAAGSIILGIAVDYSLHLLVHAKQNNNMEEIVHDIVRPLTLGSATTILAFLCLQFVNAAVLQDVGLFAAFSLLGAAMCTLIFLPHIVPAGLFQNVKPNWVDRFSQISLGSSKYPVIIILALTPVFFYFAGDVKFNTDLSGLNFMRPEVKEAQERLESINRSSLNLMYVVAQGSTIQEALRKNERAMPSLEKLKDAGIVNKYTTVTTFFLSDSLQQKRIERWNSFWTKDRKENLVSAVRKEATELKFSETVIQNFETLLTKKYSIATPETLQPFRHAFFENYLIEKDSQATVITLVNVPVANKPKVYSDMENTTVHVVDRQLIANLFAEYVHDDFNFIVMFTSILVFVFLLLSYGRIELTLISFIPMMITWIWILGIMALVGIEFNIVNVMISTFIFGLGDDYSIFTMDGLQQEYKTGKQNLPSVRASIFLSAVTVTSGLGVLVLAEHPALRSIAAISIIGIVCVYVMSQTIEPFLFKAMISNRARKGFTPMTLVGTLRTIFVYFFFISGSFMLTAIGLLLKLIPFGKKRVRLLFHTLISWYTRAQVFLGWRVRQRVLNPTSDSFDEPSVIISNHTSFMDILVTAGLHPRVILVTNKWVWNSWIFGGVVRLADYYPVTEGAEGGVERLRTRVKDGYNIVIFPEGTRSPDGKMRRFHKGAFYLAESLNIPIRPLLIHGAWNVIQKGDKYLNDGMITMKFLPAIRPDDQTFGQNYSERTKLVSRYFKEEHKKLSAELETPAFFRYKLFRNYLFKGPVLEWYMRVKVSLENNYEQFHALVPKKGTVLDLGCGYGFLCYMLSFVSEDRVITGVDYDEEKIATANHCYSKSDRVNFHYADVTKYPLATYDSIIIADVLHYLMPDAQDDLIIRCFSALNPGGVLIIRDGDSDLKERHEGTKLTELFSVKLLKFNKSTNDLNFISGTKLRQLAARHNLTVERLDDTKLTSNVIFVIRKAV